MYLLDTDILSLAYNGHLRVMERVRQAGEENVAASIITEIEILQGRFAFLLKASDGKQLLLAQHLLQGSRDSLRETTILPVDDTVAETFDQLREDRKLRKIGRADLLIACTALARKATLVTRNRRHFEQIPGLTLENWAD
jgi:tRNA(fMet)-specific endonuclease VapC